MPIHAIRQLALQAAAAILVLSLAWPYHLVAGVPLDWASTAYLTGIAAFALATWGRLPWWWRLIHLVFVPAAYQLALLQIDPAWFLAAFLILIVTFRSAAGGQVPLYLTAQPARDEVLAIARRRGAHRVVDLGAGTGSLLAPLARKAPEIHWVGIENSPLPWLIARLRCLGLSNCEVRYGDFWSADLGTADLVYAFLSPAPMRRLWQKLVSEMPSDAVLVSNSFPVPDVEPSETIEGEGLALFCYEFCHFMPGGNSHP